MLRLMPSVWLAGTLLSALGALAARLFMARDSAAELARAIEMFDYMMLGLAITVWTLVLIVSMGCVIVWIMKGPAYVADGFEVSHSDNPKP